MREVENRLSPEHIDLAILGGTSRAGKDTTQHMYAETVQNMLGKTVMVSTDEIRSGLWANASLRAVADATPGSWERALFQQKIDSELYVDDGQWIPNVLDRIEPDGTSYFLNRHDNQNKAVWRLGKVAEHIRDSLRTPGLARLFVQGVAMLPEHAAEFRDSYPKMRGLYLVNTNPSHVDVTLEVVHQAQATNPQSNWMSSWSDDRIRGYIYRNIELSYARLAQAEKYGFPWQDMGSGDFQYNVFRNVGYLANGNPL